MPVLCDPNEIYVIDPNGASISVNCMLQHLCPYRHAYLSSYPVIGRQLVLLYFLNNFSVLEKISHIHEFLRISCILMKYSLSNNLLYMLNYTFSYNKIICIFVLISSLYLFRNLLSYHRALSLPTSNSLRRDGEIRYVFNLVSFLFEPPLVIY